MDIPKSAEAIEKLSCVQKEYLADAQDANNQEHELTLLQAIKVYPKAVGWSLILSTTLIMEGYDTKLMNSLFAQPAFQEAYGNLQADGSYEISASWQAGLMNGSTAGQIVGLLIAGYISERFGFRKTMITALIITICFIFIQFFATGLIMLEVAQILLGAFNNKYRYSITNNSIGIPLGMFQTVCTVYAVEVTPVCLRAYLTTYANMCWVILITFVLMERANNCSDRSLVKSRLPVFFVAFSRCQGRGRTAFLLQYSKLFDWIKPSFNRIKAK